jgi:DNA repair protein RadC
MKMMVRDAEVVYTRRTVDVLGETKPKMSSSEDIYRLMANQAGRRTMESMWVLMLDARMRLIGMHEAAKGSMDAVYIKPRDIFRAAVMANAAAIVMVHNHPSGSATPSPEDIEFTLRVHESAELLGIPLLDHVIVTQTAYYSMLDGGQLKK